MSLATLFEMSSAVLGLFSGAFFCIGVLHLKKNSIEAIAFSMWGKGFTIASELVSQKYDFAAGAALLFIAFVLQFFVKILPEVFSITVMSSPLDGVASSLLISTLVAGVLRALSQKHCKKALQELKEKRAQQEPEANVQN